MRSRGAEKIFLCDNSRDAIKIINQNIEKTKTKDKITLLNMDYKKALEELINSLTKDMKEAAKNQEFEKAAVIRDQIASIEEIMEKQQCLTIKQLAVTGNDLIAAGMKPGKEIGEICSA